MREGEEAFPDVRGSSSYSPWPGRGFLIRLRAASCLHLRETDPNPGPSRGEPYQRQLSVLLL